MLLIQYRTGSIQQGILLSIQNNELRVAVKGGDDVMMFRLLREGWTSESHEIVTFGFPLAAFEATGMVPMPDNTVEEQAVHQLGPWSTQPVVN